MNSFQILFRRKMLNTAMDEGNETFHRTKNDYERIHFPTKWTSTQMTHWSSFGMYSTGSALRVILAENQKNVLVHDLFTVNMRSQIIQ